MKVRPEVCASLIVDCRNMWRGILAYMYAYRMGNRGLRGPLKEGQFMVDWFIQEGNVRDGCWQRNRGQEIHVRNIYGAFGML